MRNIFQYVDFISKLYIFCRVFVMIPFFNQHFLVVMLIDVQYSKGKLISPHLNSQRVQHLYLLYCMDQFQSLLRGIFQLQFQIGNNSWLQKKAIIFENQINRTLQLPLLNIGQMRSEYQEALDCLIQSYKMLINDAMTYSSRYGSSNSKVQQILAIWMHPKGISNLVKTLALHTEKRSDHKTGQNTKSLIIQDCQPEIISAPNMTLLEVVQNQPLVKQEHLSSEQPQLELDNRIQINDSPDQENSNSSCLISHERSYKRGPYKSYSMEEKTKAVEMFLNEDISITRVSKLLKIPCKNIKRWSTEGIFRKRGGGRKRTSPEMEEETYRWLLRNFHEQEEIYIDQIQEYALSHSEDPNFKASRGWVLKFIERFRLRTRFVII